MKQAILILGLIFSFATVKAQVANTTTTEQPTNQQKAHNQALKMQKMLTLSDDQTVKVEAVLLNKIEKISAITADASKTADVQQNEINGVKDASDKELAGIMTPDQYALYLHKKQEAQAARKENAH
ncbi:MAG TPA: hypothetical protein VFJ43_04785 [Bacteroidia bacterium]|nr:hypothetical protein [Bacteroidia bacterium]